MREIFKIKDTKLTRLVIVLIGAISFTSVVFLLSFFLLNQSFIYRGIFIDGVDVGGLNSVEAATKISEKIDESVKSNKLTLRYGDRKWVFSSEDIGLQHDIKGAIEDALRLGREGNFFERIAFIVRLFKEPYKLNIKSKVDVNSINNILDAIAQEIYVPCVDATIERKNGEFIITESKVGISLNKQGTFSKILHELSESNYNEPVEVEISVDTVSPRITGENLIYIQHLLGSFTTKFNANVTGRAHNIKLSSEKINGKVFLPGEIFSFNEVVGPRTLSNGYKKAPVIIQGDLVDDLGGGVCQVSSTLYNTALRSNLEIVERSNHSIPSTYVDKGLDATVSYGYIDFKFRNNTSYPIYIESFVKGNSLTVNIYGYKDNNREVKVYSRVDEVIKKPVEVIKDPNIIEGKQIVKEKGRDGYRVSSYMDIYENGVKVETRLISRDYYPAKKEVVIRGTKPRPAVKVESNENTDDE